MPLVPQIVPAAAPHTRRPAGVLAVLALLTLPLAADPRPAHAAWVPDGSAVSTATGDQTEVVSAPDGAGGVILAWTDLRSGSDSDIYAQRLDANGVPQWTAHGVAVCAAANGQSEPAIVSDGAGGAVIVWMDRRDGQGNVYAQRLDASGAAQWTADGNPVCLASALLRPRCLADGTGGAIVAWLDYRNSNLDLFAQRLDGSGATQWAGNGVALSAATEDQFDHDLASDGAGGAIAVFADERSGPHDLYAQRVDAAGAVQWAADGVVICDATGDQGQPRLVEDGAGGALIAWEDNRGAHTDVYAQRVSGSGAAQWTANGVVVSGAADYQGQVSIVTAGAGGAIIAFTDNRLGAEDVFAQRVGPAGASLWTADGVAVCTEAATQSDVRLVADGAGGAVAVWSDFRPGIESDIYAQRISASGAMVWTADGVAVCAAGDDQRGGRVIADGTGGAIVAWVDYRSGAEDDVYALRVPTVTTSVETGAGPPALTLLGSVPNPTAGATLLRFAVPAPSAVTVTIFDTRGRHVRTIADAAAVAGARALLFDGRDHEGRLLGPGVYHYRVTSAGGRASGRFAIVR